MGFCFKKEEAVPDGIRRLASERVEAALKALRATHQPKAIHAVRKDIKKARAVLRLAREAIQKKAYRRQAALLREAAQRLAPARDAYVKRATLRNLDDLFPGQLAPAALRQAHKELKKDLAREKQRLAGTRRARKVRRLLKRIPKELRSLDLESKGWKTISAGVETAFARGRLAYQAARRRPSPENLHNWRKRVKDLWYQVCLLRPICPEQMDSLATELGNLSELLGDDHDLLLLQQSFGAEKEGQLPLLQPEVLGSIIDHRRRQLRAAALRIGDRLYADAPAAFCRRLERCWKAWRKAAHRS